MKQEDKSVHNWATASFRQTLEQFERLSQTLHLAMRGIAFARNSHRIAELLHRIDGEPDDGARGLKRAQEEADLATREVEEGFPILHAQATVTLWAYLEASVRQVVADWIHNEPSCLRHAQFEKVRVRLAEYERLDPSEKPLFIVEALEREFAVGLQNGVTRFEALLAPVMLAGDVPGDLGRRIFELGQVRNVIVHRAGMADKRFCEACPWMRAEIGKALIVSHPDYAKYNRAVHDYFMLIICRVGERLGVDATIERSAVFDRYRGERNDRDEEPQPKTTEPPGPLVRG